MNGSINRDYLISVTAVVQDDAPLIEAFVDEVAAVLKNHYENYEILLIDNDSSDGTAAVMQSLLAREECIRYVKLSRRYAHEAALSAGLDTAIGDVVITLEPESDPPGLIPAFVEKAIATSGVVYGIRRNYDSYKPLSYRLGKKAFLLVCKLFFELTPPRNAGFYMALARPALNAIIQIRGKAKFLRVYGQRIGYKTDTLDYRVQPRRRPLRSRSITGNVAYGAAMIFTNSSRPLRLVSLLGLAAAALNVVFIALILSRALVGARPLDGTSLLALQLAITFVFVFLIAAVVCEHYIRSAENVTDGPSYYIEYEQTSSVMVLNADERRNVYETPSV